MIHIPIKLHERYPKRLLSYGVFKNVWTNKLKGITLKLRKRERPFLCATHRPDLIHIPLKLQEMSITATELWSVQ